MKNAFVVYWRHGTVLLCKGFFSSRKNPRPSRPGIPLGSNFEDKPLIFKTRRITWVGRPGKASGGGSQDVAKTSKRPSSAASSESESASPAVLSIGRKSAPIDDLDVLDDPFGSSLASPLGAGSSSGGGKSRNWGSPLTWIMPVVSRADRRIPWSRNVCSWNGLKDRFLSKVSKTTTNYAWKRVNAHLFLWNQGHSVFAVILTAYYSLESKLMDTRWSSHRDGYRIGDCRLKSKADKICSSSYCTFWKHICMSLYVPSRFAICSSLDSQAICSKTKAFVIMVRPTLMTSLTLLVRLLEVFFAKVWTAKR